MSDEIANTESVQTETGDAGDTTATSSVLTDGGASDASQVSTDTSGAADVAAAQAILDADDPEVSAEDKTAAKAIVDAAADAGEEGSQTSPDTYADFVLPEGMELDETALAEANPLFKEMGLNQEQAQKVVDLYSKQVQASSEKQVDNFNQLKSDWRNQSENDGEFGGDKFNENIKTAQNAIGKYGTPELKQLLEDHGVGNHPEMIRFMVRVGQTLSEDVPGSSGANTSKASDHAELLYPGSDNS